jgi:hypothetical protein
VEARVVRLTSGEVDFREVTELTHANIQGLLHRGEVRKGHGNEGNSPKGPDLRKVGAQTDSSA